MSVPPASRPNGVLGVRGCLWRGISRCFFYVFSPSSLVYFGVLWHKPLNHETGRFFYFLYILSFIVRVQILIRVGGQLRCTSVPPGLEGEGVLPSVTSVWGRYRTPDL